MFGSETSDLDGYGVTATKEEYRGRAAITVIEAKSAAESVDMLAVLKGVAFHNGAIDVWLAGEPIDADAAAQGAHGFVGIAFRVAKDPPRYPPQERSLILPIFE
jgi:hypothetical protein